MRYKPIDPQLFVANRKKFIRQLPKGGMALFLSNELMPRSADSTYPFRQHPDLFYLTGVDQEDTALILFPDCPIEKYREVLFVRKTSELIRIWEGDKLTREEAQKVSGIKTVLWKDEFEGVLKTVMYLAHTVYLNSNEHDRASARVPDYDLLFARQLRERYPLHPFARTAPLMAELRAVKSKEEIRLIKQAIAITEKAFRRVLGFVKPGVMEYEVEAEITHEFIRNGASGHAYSPIVASGKSATILHYVSNDKPCREGELLLLDFGAEYANYAADLTRTIPVSGRFTKRQKEVYNAVLRIQREVFKLLKPGKCLDEVNKETGRLVTEELLRLKLLKSDEVKKQDPEQPLWRKYMPHGVSHFLGLDVHDVGNRYKPIRPGMVFTCEPGIYIREEGIGVRLENDVLVTRNGVVDLMKNIPIEPEEIEELMA
ncbi:MAG: Xaa-Pro aminopeptidase [Chitinophagales bacterium]|nr:MAG: Xaa-Pro aminopeptidase [Chitinophagales bacterium]